MPLSGHLKELRKKVGNDLLVLPSAAVALYDDQGRVLMGLHADRRVWVLPGGLIEPVEIPADAAVREVWEETGLHVELTGILGVYGGKELLVDYVNRLERLAAQPAWYNSVSSNCTTNLFYEGHPHAPWLMKSGIFLNGYSAGTLYRLGYLSDSLPFKQLQARSEIRDRALAAGDAADFSQKIRAEMVMP